MQKEPYGLSMLQTKHSSNTGGIGRFSPFVCFMASRQQRVAEKTELLERDQEAIISGVSSCPWVWTFRTDRNTFLFRRQVDRLYKRVCLKHTETFSHSSEHSHAYHEAVCTNQRPKLIFWLRRHWLPDKKIKLIKIYMTMILYTGQNNWYTFYTEIYRNTLYSTQKRCFHIIMNFRYHNYDIIMYWPFNYDKISLYIVRKMITLTLMGPVIS